MAGLLRVSFWFLVSVYAHANRTHVVLGVLGASWVAGVSGDPESDRSPNETTDGPIGTEHKSDSSESNDGNDARSDIDTRMASHSGKHTTLAPLSLSALEGGMHKESQTRTVLGSNGRKLTPKDPSDHYFCGAGFDDASKSCEYPCPSGSLRECPLGMLCYFNTPCDRKDLPDQPSKSPTIKPGWRPPSQSPWMAGDERLSFFCGKTWDDASSKCGIWCPDTDDTVCPYGEVCFRDTLCVADPNPPGLWSPPTPAPWDENAAKLSFFCGVSWSDAGRKCKTWCPDADDSKCPSGEVCFSDTPCKWTRPPTSRPTPSPPPTDKPTGPSASPLTQPMQEHPSNHMFCGFSYADAKGNCSLETHCGENGISDCPSQSYCWAGIPCDVRRFVPYQQGGWLDRPSQKEIAEGMGLTYPSDNPSDHFFCGKSLRNANENCALPCPGGTSNRCGDNEYCYQNTECDARIRADYGSSGSDNGVKESAMIVSEEDAKKFCGTSWGDANSCRRQWCGDGSPCPGDMSCFADTDCDIRIRGRLPPSPAPTTNPVAYDDESNFKFCGQTYTAAVRDCSLETNCKKNSDCGSFQFCWSGVSCNAADMRLPTVPRTSSPTGDKPTRAPQIYDIPRNFRFCGKTWADASSQPCGGKRPCPNGSDEECPLGEQCWGDTACNRFDFSFPPSADPTNEPSFTPPTKSPVQYDDVRHKRFCGPGYFEATNRCSVETYCPGGQHHECDSGQFCWANVGCNIFDLLPPSPPPTRRPSPKPTQHPVAMEPPTFHPSPNPTRMPTRPPTRKPTQPPTDRPTDRPTGRPTGRPTDMPTDRPLGTSLPTKLDTVAPTLNPFEPSLLGGKDDQTFGPGANVDVPNSEVQETSHMSETSVQTLYLPTMSRGIPRPSNASILHIMKVVDIARATLEEDKFVIALQSQTKIKSTLYQFQGFRAALEFITTQGFGGNYFYLGDVIRSRNRKQTTYFEVGVANVALFLSKMITDAISYERCDPNHIACGIPALDTLFADDDVVVKCASDSEDGIECPSEYGCTCVLGILNKFMGIGSPGVPTELSGADFCETSLLKSVCSRRLSNGGTLRWLVSMAHWVLLVQQTEERDWNYLDELDAFVAGGMIDTAFVNKVGSASASLAASTDRETRLGEFASNFFGIIMTMSKAHSSIPKLTTNGPTPQLMVSTPNPTSPLANDPTADYTRNPTGDPVSSGSALGPEPSAEPSLVNNFHIKLDQLDESSETKKDSSQHDDLDAMWFDEDFFGFSHDPSSVPSVHSDLLSDNEAPPTKEATLDGGSDIIFTASPTRSGADVREPDENATGEEYGLVSWLRREHSGEVQFSTRHIFMGHLLVYCCLFNRII